jgi:hypothetical protein
MVPLLRRLSPIAEGKSCIDSVAGTALAGRSIAADGLVLSDEILAPLASLQ